MKFWHYAAAPIALLLGCYVWTSYKWSKETDLFRQQREINLGIVTSTDAAARHRALQSLVQSMDAEPGGLSYRVKWDSIAKSSVPIHYELLVSRPVTGEDGLMLIEVEKEHEKCWGFHNLKSDTLRKVANQTSDNQDPLDELVRQGFKKNLELDWSPSKKAAPKH